MSKEHAYAYEAVYRDGSIHYELEHCPACANVADLQEALAENAKLREELDQWHSLTAGIELPEYPISEFRPKDLERENAKLRELVSDMWFWSYCGHIDSESLERQMLHVDAVIQRMRELGIEVDG